MANENDTSSRQDDETSGKENGLPWRKNVLALLLLSYGTIFGILLVLENFGVEAKKAYNLISVPFVALVGGTLAVAKDRI